MEGKKGADAAIKANLANIRAQAALYYDTNTTYGTSVDCSITSAGTATTCTGAFASGGTNTMYEGLKAAVGAAGTGTAYGITNTAGDGWVAAVPLKSVANTYYCVDSNGAGKVVASALANMDSAATVACP